MLCLIIVIVCKTTNKSVRMMASILLALLTNHFPTATQWAIPFYKHTPPIEE